MFYISVVPRASFSGANDSKNRFLGGQFLIQSDIVGLSQANKGEVKGFSLFQVQGEPPLQSQYFLTQHVQKKNAARWCYNRYTDAIILSYQWVKTNHSLILKLPSHSCRKNFPHQKMIESRYIYFFIHNFQRNYAHFILNCVIIFQNILLSFFRNRTKKHSGEEAFQACLVFSSSFLRLCSQVLFINT